MSKSSFRSSFFYRTHICTPRPRLLPDRASLFFPARPGLAMPQPRLLRRRSPCLAIGTKAATPVRFAAFIQQRHLGVSSAAVAPQHLLPGPGSPLAPRSRSSSRPARQRGGAGGSSLGPLLPFTSLSLFLSHSPDVVASSRETLALRPSRVAALAALRWPSSGEAAHRRPYLSPVSSFIYLVKTVDLVF
jgi:hypothetical protein